MISLLERSLPRRDVCAEIQAGVFTLSQPILRLFVGYAVCLLTTGCFSAPQQNLGESAPIAGLGTETSSSASTKPPSQSKKGFVISNLQLATYQYHNIQWYAYVDASLRSRYAVNSAIPEIDKLDRIEVYLTPSAQLDLEWHKSAYVRKLPVYEKDGVPYYEMEFKVDLLPDDKKQVAIDDINKQFSARVPKENVSLVPFDYVALSATVDNKTIDIGMWPSLDPLSSKRGEPASYSLSPTFLVTASDETLQALLSRAEWHMSYSLNAVSTSVNAVNMTLGAISQLGYKEFLNGKADMQRLAELEHKYISAGLSIGPAAADAGIARTDSFSTQRSFVSRYQVRDVVRSAVKVLNVTSWRESNRDLPPYMTEKVIDNATNQLLDRMEKIEIEVDEEGKAILDDKMKRDLSPDEVSEVEFAVKDDFDRTNEKKSTNKSRSKTETPDTISKSKGKSDSKSVYRSKDVVPKTIVYQADNTSLYKDLDTVNFQDQVVRDEEMKLSQDVEIGSWKETAAQTDDFHKLQFRIDIDKVPRLSGGDADVFATASKSPAYNFRIGRVYLKNDVICIDHRLRVEELGGDFTVLEASNTTKVPIPEGVKVVSVAEYVPYEWSRAGGFFGPDASRPLSIPISLPQKVESPRQ